MIDDYISEDDNKTQSSIKKSRVEKKESKVQEDIITQQTIKEWFEEDKIFYPNKICMVLGEDGTGKTGLVLDYVSKELKKDSKVKAVVIDLDRGARTLIGKFHKDYLKQYILLDPRKKSEYINKNNEIVEDPLKVMKLIMHSSKYIYENYEKENIKFVVLDGLSTLLNIAESQMRLDMNKEITDGIQQLYWKKRKDNFFKVLNLLTSIPVDLFFIGHTNFILEEKATAIPRDTNAMMAQRIICEKEEGIESNEVLLKAHINKSRDNPLKLNDKKIFMQVKGKEFKFNSDKVFEGL